MFPRFLRFVRCLVFGVCVLCAVFGSVVCVFGFVFVVVPLSVSSGCAVSCLWRLCPLRCLLVRCPCLRFRRCVCFLVGVFGLCGVLSVVSVSFALSLVPLSAPSTP